jgi:MSHA pilin protein MshD
MVRKQAMAMADSILEEILQKEYSDPDGVQGNETTRATMDDVDDYNGKTKAIFTDWPSALGSYTVAIAVTTTTLGGVAAKKVTVTVTGGTNDITMTGYRTNY